MDASSVPGVSGYDTVHGVTDVAQTPAGRTPGVKVTALFAEAVGKSAVCWIQIETRAYAVWHVWDREALLVVTGAGEQSLPPLPDPVTILVRSKDTGGRLLAITAHPLALSVNEAMWEPAATALAAKRLNATDDQVERWRTSATIYALHPYGAPLEAPGSYGTVSGAQRVRPGRGTTLRWRPAHLGGRPWLRRRQRS